MMYFQGNQICSILLLTSILGLALEAKKIPEQNPQGNKGVCFLVGQAKLPSDVVVNKALAKSCLGVSAFPKESTLKKIPDIKFNNVKFSDISYVKRKSGTSTVRFAIDTFGKKSKADLQTALELYNAVNAGLRSIDDGAAKKILGELKGVNFFLQMLIGVQDKNEAIVKRNQAKTQKNCYKCTKKDKDDVDNLARTVVKKP